MAVFQKIFLSFLKKKSLLDGTSIGDPFSIIEGLIMNSVCVAADCKGHMSELLSL